MLASVHSDKENALVTSLVYNDTGSEYFGGVWIGASCPGYANRDFSWVDGSDFNIQNWASDQPSDVRLTCLVSIVKKVMAMAICYRFSTVLDCKYN